MHLGVLALFALLTAAATWPLARMAWWGTLDYGDTLTVAHGIAWQAHALATDPAHLLDANIMYPFRHTLAFDELNFAPALLGAPLFWLSGNALLDYNAVTLLSFVLSGYGCWLLVRELTGSSWAGLVAGVAFAFSFFRFNNLAHLTILNTQWLPLVLFWLHRLWRRPSWPAALAFAGFFALQVLSSHYLAFYTVGVTVLFLAFYMVAERRVPRPVLGRVLAGVLLAGVVIAPIAAGYLVGQRGGFHRELWDIKRYTATLESYLAVYNGNPLYARLLQPFADPSPWPWERSLFPGVVAPALALAGGWAAWRMRRSVPWAPHALFYGLLTAIAVVLSFGPQLTPTFADEPTVAMPYMLLYALVPGAQTMRVVTRIGVLFTLGLSVLAGFGVAVLLAGAGRTVLRRAAPVVLGALLLLETWNAPLAVASVPSGAGIPPVYRWLAQQPPGTPVVEYPMMHLQRGPRNVAMISLYQYYSTYHWLPTPNGAMTVRPLAWTALTEEMETCFPCPRSLDILWALGVPLAAVHLENLSGAQQQDFAWRSTAGLPAGLYPGEFTPLPDADFGDTKVFRIARAGPHPLAELRGLLRPGATLALGAANADPWRSGAYLDALGYWLRDWPQTGDPDRSFGQVIAPRGGAPADYALLYTGEAPAPYGFTATDARWHNEHVVLYGRR
ncbi:MAG TPA: hypothetical protein VM536_06680 [Chloroflexia bacterium]|nr:hypothetical protein [Chloroflexia bacterium]